MGNAKAKPHPPKEREKLKQEEMIGRSMNHELGYLSTSNLMNSCHLLSPDCLLLEQACLELGETAKTGTWVCFDRGTCFSSSWEFWMYSNSQP